MIKIESLINLLKKNKCDFFSGVPDSVLKELSSSLQNKKKHPANGKIHTHDYTSVTVVC